MIYGNINNLGRNATLFHNHPWNEAFKWLGELGSKHPLGILERHDGQMTLNVHTYKTIPRSQCRFENHKHTIDIQYTITGGEYIDWANSDNLTPDGDYISDRDKQYFFNPMNSLNTSIHMAAHHFAVFMPDDVHCPKIHDGLHDKILKAVIKIESTLIP